MRLFVAVTPPAEAIAELSAALAGLPEAALQDARLRWTPAGQWHLTLAFLGEVDERRRADVTQRLGRAAGRARELRLSFGGAGRFGHRVLWAGVHGDVAALCRLAEACSAAARRAKIPLETRGYRPHLTLARAGGGTDLRPLVAALSGFGGSPWTATELHLVHSELGAGPGGHARHRPLVSWQLPAKPD